PPFTGNTIYMSGDWDVPDHELFAQTAPDLAPGSGVVEDPRTSRQRIHDFFFGNGNRIIWGVPPPLDWETPMDGISSTRFRWVPDPRLGIGAGVATFPL